jgi:AraC-like DNA-binding protein/mannose-6-phosphate isomerase-like protein (cupin superfamily)
VQPAIREQARRTEDSSFAVFDVQVSPRTYFNWHWHDDCEIVMVGSGGGLRFVGDSIDEYRAGEVVLIGPGVPHTWCPARGVESGGSAQVIHLDPDSALWPEFDSVTRLIGQADRGLLFPPDTVRAIESPMAAAQRGATAQRAIAVLHVLAELALRAGSARTLSARSFLPGRQAGGGRETDAARRIEAVRGFVVDHFDQPLVQSDVAQIMGMTPAAFCRFFRRNTGRTFTRYVQEVRLIEAGRLLAETSAPVTEIAIRVGFNNLAHFNRSFRRLRGVTPSTWRSAMRSGSRGAPGAPPTAAQITGVAPLPD